MKLEGNIKTTVICSEDRQHVYEITKEFDCEGEEVMLLTLYPTLDDAYSLDSSTMHMINHASEMGINKIHFIYLFSQVQSGKLSTRKLTVDEENLDYLKELMEANPKVKLIVSFGSSMEKCKAAIESKVKLFSIVQASRPEEPLWQLDADGMEEEAPHILFAGIRHADDEWSLRHYKVPLKYTAEGYKAYLAASEQKRERFIQNVLNRKNKASTGQKESTQVETVEVKVDVEPAIENTKKGRKKHGKQAE